MCTPRLILLGGQIRKKKMDETCCTLTGQRTDVYFVLLRKPEASMPCGRHRRRWKYNIKIDLEE